MNLGEAIGIYFAVAIFIILVFCLLTIIFHFLTQKEHDELINQHQPIENSQEKENPIDEEIQQLINKNMMKRQQMKPNDNINYEMIQLTNLRQPLGPNNNFNIYAASPIKINQQDQYEYAPKLSKAITDKNVNTPQSRSTKIDIDLLQEKQYSPSKLNKPTIFKISQENDITNHKFIGKIVRYQNDRIQIVENCVKSITKINSNTIVQKTKIKYNVIKKQSSDFQDLLEGYGFQQNQYSCYKYTTYIQIPKMRMKEVYFISNLKCTEHKQIVSKQQYMNLKQTLNQNN